MHLPRAGSKSHGIARATGQANEVLCCKIIYFLPCRDLLIVLQCWTMGGPDLPSSRYALQEYLGLLHDAMFSSDAQSRDLRLLRAWGVLRYILSGPMQCEQCQTQVRLAIPIISERLGGQTLQYECLCTN